ncbi:hypothetical protein D0T56_09030 [Dysgonomonas sp. 520]|nr:hypothetical protein [Dysgonomonas sp. 520]
MLILFSLIVCCIFYACSNQKKIDTIIEFVEQKNVISEFKGYTLYYRASGDEPGTSLIYVKKANVECQPYIVLVDVENAKIIRINNTDVIDTCQKDYIGYQMIVKLVQKFLDSKLYYVSVDLDDTLYINPFTTEFACLIKKSKIPSSTPRNFEYFKRYKDDWYIRK